MCTKFKINRNLHFLILISTLSNHQISVIKYGKHHQISGAKRLKEVYGMLITKIKYEILKILT